MNQLIIASYCGYRHCSCSGPEQMKRAEGGGAEVGDGAKMVLTLAEERLELLLVPLDLGPAGDAHLLLPEGLDVLGVLAHFLVVQFHLANVQLISAGCGRMCERERERGREREKARER